MATQNAQTSTSREFASRHEVGTGRVSRQRAGHCCAKHELVSQTRVADTSSAARRERQAGERQSVLVSRVCAHLPRFSGEAGKDNQALVEELRAFATRLGRTPAQLCTARVLTRQPGFVPLSGARTPAQLDVLDAAQRRLSADEMAELERLVPKGAVKGSRYPEAQMAQLDSER